MFSAFVRAGLEDREAGLRFRREFSIPARLSSRRSWSGISLARPLRRNRFIPTWGG